MVRGDILDETGYLHFLNQHFEVVSVTETVTLVDFAKNKLKMKDLSELTNTPGAAVDPDGYLIDFHGNRVIKNDDYVSELKFKVERFRCKYCQVLLCKNDNKFKPQTLVNHLTVWQKNGKYKSCTEIELHRVEGIDTSWLKF